MQKDKDGIYVISEEDIEAHGKAYNITPIRPIEYIPPLKFSDIEINIPPEKEYALYPIMPVQGIIFIFAATGVGKTLFTLNMAYAIAAGGNFLKFAAPKPRKVLYIDAEMAYVDVHARLMDMKRQQGTLDFLDNFMLYTPDQLIPAGRTEPIRMPKICSPEGQAFYDMAIEKEGADVIILDNLSMLSTIDLDKAHEWHIINDWILALRAKRKTVIVVHHAGKNGDYRGTSRMLDAVDTAISLQSIDDSCAEEGIEQNAKRFKIVYKKNRSNNPLFPFEVTLKDDKWDYRTLELSTSDKIIECINAKMSQREIAKEMMLSQPTVNRLIYKLRKKGLIRD